MTTAKRGVNIHNQLRSKIHCEPCVTRGDDDEGMMVTQVELFYSRATFTVENETLLLQF